MIKNLTKLGNCFHNGFIRNLPSLVIYLLIFVWLGVVFSCVSDYKSVYIDLFIHRHAKNRPSWSSNSGCRCSKSFNNSRSFNSSSNIFLVNKFTSPFRCSSSIHLFYLLQHSQVIHHLLACTQNKTPSLESNHSNKLSNHCRPCHQLLEILPCHPSLSTPPTMTMTTPRIICSEEDIITSL